MQSPSTSRKVGGQSPEMPNRRRMKEGHASIFDGSVTHSNFSLLNKSPIVDCARGHIGVTTICDGRDVNPTTLIPIAMRKM